MWISFVEGNGKNKYVIDAYAIRNIAAFINFGCNEKVNLEVRKIASPSGDSRLPRVGFFAKEAIPAGAELLYQRDRAATSLRRRNMSIPCKCGAAKCAGFV